jgi:hypothetical protein
MPKYNFTWVTEAPIRNVSKRAAKQLAVRLKANVEDWIKGYAPPADRIAGIPTQPQIDGTLGMCDYVAKHTADSNDMDGYVYEICGAPVAIMILGSADNDYTYVDDLVTHPAAEFAGSIMLEYALTLAAKQGWNPVLQLWAYDQNALAAYRALGFERIPNEEEQSLQLDARKSAKWKETNGEWKYVSSRAMGPDYLKTTLPPPPPIPQRPAPTKV